MTCSCENGEYLANCIDDFALMCDSIVNAADSITTNGSVKVMNSIPTNFRNKKVRFKMDCWILSTVLLLVILLFLITIICYHYTEHRPKQKTIGTLTI